MGLRPIKQKHEHELTCEEQEQLSEQRLEESLFSSDVGFRRYAKENQPTWEFE